MSRQLDPKEPIYINSNNFDSELIFSNQGKLEQGLNEYVYEIATAIQAANEGICEADLRGGIIYLHSNIIENCFNYREVMLTSVFLAMSQVNGTL